MNRNVPFKLRSRYVAPVLTPAQQLHNMIQMNHYKLKDAAAASAAAASAAAASAAAAAAATKVKPIDETELKIAEIQAKMESAKEAAISEAIRKAQLVIDANLMQAKIDAERVIQTANELKKQLEKETNDAVERERIYIMHTTQLSKELEIARQFQIDQAAKIEQEKIVEASVVAAKMEQEKMVEASVVASTVASTVASAEQLDLSEKLEQEKVKDVKQTKQINTNVIIPPVLTEQEILDAASLRAFKMMEQAKKCVELAHDATSREQAARMIEHAQKFVEAASLDQAAALSRRSRNTINQPVVVSGCNVAQQSNEVPHVEVTKPELTTVSIIESTYPIRIKREKPMVPVPKKIESRVKTIVEKSSATNAPGKSTNRSSNNIGCHSTAMNNRVGMRNLR
jgi:hypothetical protein